jgi:predicted XRE-type DNA-binding protein
VASNIQQDVKNVLDFAKAVEQAALSIKGVSDLLGDTLSATSEKSVFFTMQKSIDLVQKRIQEQEKADRQSVLASSMLERITGMNAIARAETIKELGPDSLLSRVSDGMFKTVNDYGKSMITFLDGTTVKAAAAFGDINELFENFNNAILDDTRLTVAAQRNINYDLVESTKLATKQLGLSQADLNEIFQKELSEQGEITGKALKDFEKTALTAAQSTGMSVTLITKDMAKMTSDFAHFGMMTNEQMASLSVNIHQLGMDISDVTRLSDNFSSFDKAAATMSNLAASTGATLDTLELFKLANTDQEEFIRSLRQQLEDQGVEFESMNFLQQKQIASAFGLDPRVMQRLLSDNFEMVDNMTTQFQAAKDETSDETLRATLVGLGSLRDEVSKLDVATLAHRVASLQGASAQVAQDLEKTYRSVLQLTDVGVAKLGGGLDDMVKKAEHARKMLVDFSENVVTQNLQATPALAATYDKVGHQIAESMARGLENSKPVIREIAFGVGKELVAGLKAGSSDLTPRSPSVFGTEIIKGIELAFKKFDDEKVAANFGGKMSDDLKKTLASKRQEITSTLQGIGAEIEAESSVAAMTKSGADVNALIAGRYKDILTAEQVAKLRSGGAEAVASEMYEKQIKGLAAPAAPAAGAAAATGTAATPGAPTKIELTPQDIKIHVTLSGGDALTQLLADAIIGAATSADGIKLTSSGDNIKLATVGKTDATS